MEKYINLYKPHPSKFPHWFSKELQSSLKHKDSAHKKTKRSGLDKWKAQFSRYRSLRKSLYRRDHKCYMESLEAAASQQPADFWRYVRCRSKAPQEHISLLNFNGEQITDVAASFAEYFHSIFQMPDANDVHPTFNHMSNFNKIMLDEKLVNDSLKRMKPSFSCGADGIPAAIMKAYGNSFVPVLTSIYNNCLL